MNFNILLPSFAANKVIIRVLVGADAHLQLIPISPKVHILPTTGTPHPYPFTHIIKLEIKSPKVFSF